MQDQWADQDEWQRRLKGDDCPMCASVKAAKDDVFVNDHGYVVAMLERSMLQLQRNQNVRGYCVLIAHKHYTEPFQMYEGERRLFFEDMNRAAEAMQQVFGPDKMNYEMLGNNVPHLHVHLKPRYLGDRAPHGRITSGADDPRYLSDDEYMQIVGDLREAMGMIRVPITDPLLKPITDEKGRINRWPQLKEPEAQMAVRAYLASKFEANRSYNEREVNAVLNEWHTFEDWAMLRRELFGAEFLRRLKNGTSYWVNEERENAYAESG